MQNICKQNLCTGCGVCAVVCPKKCVSMSENEHGFLYPNVDESKCVNCNLCRKKCPQNNQMVYNKPLQVWAAWNKNNAERKTSASGGIAAGLYLNATENDYVVSGVQMEDGFSVRHTLTEKKTEIHKYKSSQYVQSIAFPVFTNIKTQLDKGKHVLFIGTPCQVDGLKSFLSKEYERLVTVDLICHGVPSSKYLKEHAYTVCGCDERCSAASFRDSEGWKLRIFSRGKVVYEKKAHHDLYFKAFLLGLTYRESCYHCKYAQQSRVGDLTIGDFWGLGKIAPVNYPIDKVSLVLTNTDKGSRFFENSGDQFVKELRTIEEAIIDNDQLQHSSVPHRNRIRFMNLYSRYGFDRAVSVAIKADLRKAKLSEMYQKVKYKLRILGKG